MGCGLSTREYLETAGTCLLFVCALAVTVLFVRRELAPTPDPRAPRPPEFRADWKAYLGGRKTFGQSRAPVTVVEFSDFQCPFCARFARVVDSLSIKYPDRIRVIFRNFPLTGLHPHARSAALAAECAAAEGRFAAYHDVLFLHQDSIGVRSWESIAHSVGISNIASFRGCMQSATAIAALREDSLAGVALGVNGTPTIIVNGWVFAGAPSMRQVEAVMAK